jgi:hypothetical protein
LVTIAAIALPIVAVVALHRLGSLDWLRIDFGDLDGWARRSRIEDAFAAVLRYIALGGAYWLAVSSVLYLLARLSGVSRLIDATALLTLPAVRRITDRLVVGTLAISAMAGPAIAISGQWSDRAPAADPIATRLGAERAPNTDTVIDLSTIDEQDLERLTPPMPPSADRRFEASPRSDSKALESDPSDPATPLSITIRAAADLEVVVTEGDHLWGLAERRVSALLGRPAADHEIAPYWRQVISSNPEIRSGDPDVIYPGEVIVLPPLG